MATKGTFRPTRLTSSESDMDELKAHSLLLTLIPTVASLDRSGFVGLTTEVVEKLFERFSKILEGGIKLPQSFEHDQFVVLFQKDETSLSRRIMQGQGPIDLSLGDKEHSYIRSCNTLEKVESKNPYLFKVLIQNVEHCILHMQGQGSIDFSLGDKKHTYIRSCNTLEKVESENPYLFKVLIQNGRTLYVAWATKRS